MTRRNKILYNNLQQKISQFEDDIQTLKMVLADLELLEGEYIAKDYPYNNKYSKIMDDSTRLHIMRAEIGADTKINEVQINADRENWFKINNGQTFKIIRTSPSKESYISAFRDI